MRNRRAAGNPRPRPAPRITSAPMLSRLFSRTRLLGAAVNLVLLLGILAVSPARPWAFAAWREMRVDSLFEATLRAPGDRVEIDRIAQAVGAGGWRRACVLTPVQDPRELKPMAGELAAKIPHDAAMDGSNVLVFAMDDWERMSASGISSSRRDARSAN